MSTPYKRIKPLTDAQLRSEIKRITAAIRAEESSASPRPPRQKTSKPRPRAAPAGRPAEKTDDDLRREIAALHAAIAQATPRGNPAKPISLIDKLMERAHALVAQTEQACYAAQREVLRAQADTYHGGTNAQEERANRALAAARADERAAQGRRREAEQLRAALWARYKPARRNPEATPSAYPTSVQRCVVHVATREASLDGRRTPSGRDVGKAFAVCVSGAQKAMVLKPGTRQVTTRGAARQARYTPQERREGERAYEAVLKSAKAARKNPARKSRKTDPLKYGDLVEILPPGPSEGKTESVLDDWTSGVGAHKIGVVTGIWMGREQSRYELVGVTIPGMGELLAPRHAIRPARG